MKETNYVVKGYDNCRTSKDSLGVEKENEIIAFFKDKGFTITPEAIRHNFEAWLDDFKSGFRDEANKTFLFTPCGCNPLKFVVDQIMAGCESWQKTYIS